MNINLKVVAAVFEAIKDNRTILVFAPSHYPIKNFFEDLFQFCQDNPYRNLLDLKHLVHPRPFYSLKFTNGSLIRAFTLGFNQGSESQCGVTADVVILLESQEFTESDWKVIKPIMLGGVTRKGKVAVYE